MSQANSAGLVLYRLGEDGHEILLVHPGGPFWAKKDANGWSIPKGEFDPGTEDAYEAARREFAEETGHEPPEGAATPLPVFKAGKKAIHAWLVEGDLDPETIVSNDFDMEWPPRSGKTASFPEVDRAAWFTLDVAEDKLHKGQLPISKHVKAALHLS